jgi:hypothetical protein
MQYILDPYRATTYYTLYIKYIYKSITSKLHSIIKNCIVNNINAYTKIQKLGNASFFNAQQMVI